MFSEPKYYPDRQGFKTDPSKFSFKCVERGTESKREIEAEMLYFKINLGFV
jgi:hypothetical protein